MAIVVDVQIAPEVSCDLAPDALSDNSDATIERVIERCVQHTCVDQKVNQGTVTVRIVTQEESAALNHAFRNKPGPTNVLSFPYDLEADGVPLELLAGDALPEDETPLGDLVICAPVVIAEAHQQGKSPGDHYAHMVVHGVLHLLGYDHIKVDEATHMEGLETHLLHQLGVNNPYQLSA